MIFDDNIKFCASLVETSDPHRFRSIMAAPEKLRPYYFVIFAFNIEVSRAPYFAGYPVKELILTAEVVGSHIHGK